MKKQLSLMVGAASLFVMASVASATTMIDHFVYAPLLPDLTANSNAPIVSATQPASGTDATILGGKRAVTLRWVDGESDVGLKRPSAPSAHYITCTSEFGTVGSWEFNWGNTYAGGSNLGDLSDGGGADGFAISFMGSDRAVDINMTVRDTGGTTQTVVGSTPAGGPGIVHFSFASFNTIATFASIDSIRFDFTAPAAADFAIDYITTIPEPASMALFGLLGLGLIRRRR